MNAVRAATPRSMPRMVAAAHSPSGLLSRRRLAAASVFLLAGGASALAQSADRPITAAILFLLGVTMVGAIEGVLGGLVAAVIASLTYNIFLVEPAFRFSLATLEDYVPLIAFNLGAAASGLLTGRLHDRARAAERATAKVESLLQLSEELQRAVDRRQLAHAVQAFGQPHGLSFELYEMVEGALVQIGSGSAHAPLAERARSRNISISEHDVDAILLEGSRGLLGVLVADAHHSDRSWDDLEGVGILTAMALERCRLFADLADAELVRRSEEYKTALLSSVSHDMRTPLSAISASVSSLVGFGPELAEEDKADLLAMIQEECARLDRYTGNLLHLSRIQAGLDPQSIASSDAVEVLNAAVAKVRALAGDREIHKDVEDREAMVAADPVMLEQVFLNVLENSIHYGAVGTPIHVSAAFSDGCLRVEIRDHGEGLEDDELERIFERFYRAPRSRGRPGSGLGLAIARGFVAAFGGDISAARPEDEAGGTVMIIRLPLK